MIAVIELCIGVLGAEFSSTLRLVDVRDADVNNQSPSATAEATAPTTSPTTSLDRIHCLDNSYL